MISKGLRILQTVIQGPELLLHVEFDCIYAHTTLLSCQPLFEVAGFTGFHHQTVHLDFWGLLKLDHDLLLQVAI